MDTTRLARAVHLDVTADGPGRWLVSGGREPHTVTGDAPDALTCDCTDAAMRPNELCKHRLRVLLALGNFDVVTALRALVPLPSRPRRSRGAAA